MSNDTRQFDLEALSEARKRAVSSRERDLISKTEHKILNESEEVASDRSRMMNAMRGGDTKFVREMTEKLHREEHDR